MPAAQSMSDMSGMDSLIHKPQLASNRRSSAVQQMLDYTSGSAQEDYTYGSDSSGTGDRSTQKADMGVTILRHHNSAHRPSRPPHLPARCCPHLSCTSLLPPPPAPQLPSLLSPPCSPLLALTSLPCAWLRMCARYAEHVAPFLPRLASLPMCPLPV